ncbi:MAG: O-antigen ligase family protein [Bacteroidota bacterium]|nr:O-antigen ligase family protein [Bacteroidota bacterium]
MSKLMAEKFPDILYVLMLAQLYIISISIAAASVLFGVMLLLLVVWSVTERRWLLSGTVLDYFFLAYLAVELITAATAVYPAEALYNTKRLLLISIVYVVLLSFDSRKKIERSLLLLIVTIALLSLGEIAYYFTSHEARLYVFQSYMTTGGLKMIVCLLSVPFLLHGSAPAKMKFWIALLFLPTFFALLLTDTRSSWLGFLFGLFVIGILKNRAVIVALLVIVALFFLFAPPSQIERAKSIVNPYHPANIGRLHMWSTGMKIFAAHPILGVGDSDMHKIYMEYKAPDDVETGGHLHNDYIMLLVTLGSIGFLIVMAMFVKIGTVELGILHRFSSDWLGSSVALGAFAAFCGFLVNGMFEWNFGDHEIMVFIWFTVGLTLAVERVATREIT